MKFPVAVSTKQFTLRQFFPYPFQGPLSLLHSVYAGQFLCRVNVVKIQTSRKVFATLFTLTLTFYFIDQVVDGIPASIPAIPKLI
jgi:hypothetical protein